ncbi:hypothetical protein Cgig2_006314 [Carnegiea gigantea]|uniref:Reverse transcriptase n=1 Tax=Carnegiea gigantea TaxID=171969 RepID=A0A9Q1JH39_9CARY|nr:hypothetical protein Cgig2_006314 [Carnegiea gigantea]
MVVDENATITPSSEAFKCKLDGSKGRKGSKRFGWSMRVGTIWEAKAEVNLLSYSLHHMDATVKLNGENLNKWRTGDMISNLKSHYTLAWLIRGDINEIFYHSEKCEGPSKPQAQIDAFTDAFVDNGLFDRGYEGYGFTWHRSVGGSVVVEERLDRFCASVEWSLHYPEATVYHIDSDLSDHLSILLKCYPIRALRVRRDKRFRFENMWCVDPSCIDTIKEVWGEDGEADALHNYMPKAEQCAKALQRWNTEHFGHIGTRIK